MFILCFVLVNTIVLHSAFDKWLATHCPRGYYGILCKSNCPYPNYGKQCTEICDCSEQDCHHIYGCPKSVCSVGFFGEYCETKCQFPSYGQQCNETCRCLEIHCNFTFGCPKKTIIETMSTAPVSSESKIITQDNNIVTNTINSDGLTSKQTRITAAAVTVTEETITANVTYQSPMNDWLTRIIYVIFHCHLLMVAASNDNCEGRLHGCCEGYKFNATLNNCVECPVGFYTSSNCSSPCPYPSYGKDCQSICNCTKDVCDIVQGCTEENENRTAVVSKKIAQKSSPEMSSKTAMTSALTGLVSLAVLVLIGYAILKQYGGRNKPMLDIVEMDQREKPDKCNNL